MRCSPYTGRMVDVTARDGGRRCVRNDDESDEESSPSIFGRDGERVEVSSTSRLPPTALLGPGYVSNPNCASMALNTLVVSRGRR